MTEGAIGVFDSGIGGLSVLKELLKAFPNEDFIYLGDTARLPYGSKSPETIRKYSIQLMDYLVAQNVKAIVIACNSASSQVNETHYKSRPVYNVITPGAQKAIQMSKSKCVGVLGTRATIQSEAYLKKIKFLEPSIEVLSMACPLFVPLAEEGLDGHTLTNQTVEMYLEPLINNRVTTKKIDTLILGCTHYPLLKKSISQFTKDIYLVDSGTAMAEAIQSDMKNGKLAPASALGGARTSRHIELQTTDRSDHYKTLAQSILQLNTPIDFTVVSL